MLKFYHDKERRAVLAVPDEPAVIERKDHSRAIHWFVTLEWTTIRAGKEHKFSTTGEYPAGRDDREAAIRWFRMTKYPQGGEEIDASTFCRLRSEYLEDKQNK